MTLAYSSWGKTWPTTKYGRDQAHSWIICVPRAPGCEKLMDSDDVLQVNCRYTVRVYYVSDTDDAMHVTFYPMIEPETSFDLPLTAVYAWDAVSTAATESDEYPGIGTNFNGSWTRDICLPCSLMEIDIWADLDHAEITGGTAGLAVGIHWDEDTNPSEDVPVWDWSSAAISDTQMPASSVVCMKALAETYNRMIWGAIWEIQAATP